MPLDSNNEFLKDTLEVLPSLQDRYSNIRLVNWDEEKDKKRGVFSLVFRAKDITTDRDVAIKFYDLSTRATKDQYRTLAFKRESELLRLLLSYERCLQLVQGLSTFDLEVPVGNGKKISLGCNYFVVEWITDDIDAYFFEKKASRGAAAEKLRLFNDIILATAALHRREIFHRDIKIDNLRACQREAQNVVVAIDLGTAARLDSGQISTDYDFIVGAPAYSAPEAICGLAGNRSIAKYTDIYALGCLLFELFNPEHFAKRLVSLNSGYEARLNVMARYVGKPTSEASAVQLWHEALVNFGHGINGPTIDAPGHSMPPAVAPMLNELLASMTSFDYRNRPENVEAVLPKLWGAIRALENEQIYQSRLAKVRALREARRAAVARKDERFAKARSARALT